MRSFQYCVSFAGFSNRSANLHLLFYPLPFELQAGTEGVFKTRELVFETVPQMTKLEIKQFLRAAYGIDVNAVHSLVRMGRRKNELTRLPVQEKDIKRFYIKLKSEVELPNVPKPLDQVKKAASS